MPELILYVGFRMVSCHNGNGPISDGNALDVTKRDRFELISAYLDGEVTPAERLLVTNWLAHDPEVQNLYRRLLLLRQAFRTLPSSTAGTQDPKPQVSGRLAPHSPSIQAAAAEFMPDGTSGLPEIALQADTEHRTVEQQAAALRPGQHSLFQTCQRRRLRTASLALAFTATTLLVTSLTSVVSDRLLPWQLSQQEQPNLQATPHVDGIDEVPELALDEPAIDLPPGAASEQVPDESIENAVH